MKVSVVIPCYNAEAYLAQTLGSVLEQRRLPDEVVVVDDGSTDGSLAIARGFAARFPDRVRVVSRRFGRASRVRNFGASLTQGDALMFLDADDVLDPEALGAMVEALARRPGAIALCPWHRLELVEGRWVQRPASCRRRGRREDPLKGWLTGWFHPPCSVLWSRAAYDRTGGWDEVATVNDDGDIMMRALVADTPVVMASAGAAFYRRLPEGEVSLSGKRFTHDAVADRLRVIGKIATLLAERGKLPRYRGPVSEAFAAIAADARDQHPDLHAQGEAKARQHAPPAWRRAASAAWRPLKRTVRRLAAALGRGGSAGELHSARGAAQPGSEVEVRYGLTCAREVVERMKRAETRCP